MWRRFRKSSLVNPSGIFLFKNTSAATTSQSVVIPRRFNSVSFLMLKRVRIRMIKGRYQVFMTKYCSVWLRNDQAIRIQELGQFQRKLLPSCIGIGWNPLGKAQFVSAALKSAGLGQGGSKNQGARPQGIAGPVSSGQSPQSWANPDSITLFDPSEQQIQNQFESQVQFRKLCDSMQSLRRNLPRLYCCRRPTLVSSPLSALVSLQSQYLCRVYLAPCLKSSATYSRSVVWAAAARISTARYAMSMIMCGSVTISY